MVAHGGESPTRKANARRHVVHAAVKIAKLNHPTSQTSFLNSPHGIQCYLAGNADFIGRRAGFFPVVHRVQKTKRQPAGGALSGVPAEPGVFPDVVQGGLPALVFLSFRRGDYAARCHFVFGGSADLFFHPVAVTIAAAAEAAILCALRARSFPHFCHQHHFGTQPQRLLVVPEWGADIDNGFRHRSRGDCQFVRLPRFEF